MRAVCPPALLHRLFGRRPSARKAKVDALLAYASAHLHMPPVLWHDSVLYGDSRIRGAKQAVGVPASSVDDVRAGS